MPKTRRGWKLYEQRVGAKVGARRVPVTGRQGPGGDPGDLVLPGFYVEIRSRNRARPLRWMLEVWEEAQARGVKPLLIVRGNKPWLSPLAIMRWDDLAEVIRRAGLSAAAGPAADREGPGPDRGPRDGRT